MCRGTGGTVLDVGARGGEQTIEALKLNFTQHDEVRSRVPSRRVVSTAWHLAQYASRDAAAHVCAGNDISLKTLYNAEGATSLMASTIKGHKAEDEAAMRPPLYNRTRSSPRL